MDVDERGGGFGRTAMADGGRGAIPAGLGLGRTRGGMEEFRGEAKEALA